MNRKVSAVPGSCPLSRRASRSSRARSLLKRSSSRASCAWLSMPSPFSNERRVLSRGLRSFPQHHRARILPSIARPLDEDHLRVGKIRARALPNAAKRQQRDLSSDSPSTFPQFRIGMPCPATCLGCDTDKHATARTHASARSLRTSWRRYSERPRPSELARSSMAETSSGVSR